VKLWRFKFRAVRRAGRRARQATFSAANIPAVIALFVVAAMALFADHQNNIVSQQNLRANVAAEVSLMRAKLEGNINGNLQLVRGLIASLSTEPDMTQARFEELAELVFRDRSQLRNIAGAPNLVISLMYPMAGNERAIGLDYAPRRRSATARSRRAIPANWCSTGPYSSSRAGWASSAASRCSSTGRGAGGSGGWSPPSSMPSGSIGTAACWPTTCRSTSHWRGPMPTAP